MDFQFQEIFLKMSTRFFTICVLIIEYVSVEDLNFLYEALNLCHQSVVVRQQLECLEII